MKNLLPLFLWPFLANLAIGQQPKLPDSVTIGGIFDQGDPSAKAFQFAVDMINEDRSLLVRTRLIPSVFEIPEGDSFKASKQVCEMTANPGLTSIVGPLSASAANHVQNMANQMHVPHIETRFDYAPQTPDFSINVHPHPSVLGKAYADLIRALGWKSLAILFQTEDSLVKLQEVLKLPQTFEDIKITLRQLDLTTDDYRPLLKELKKSGETKIVLDCEFEKIQNILKQAKEIELTSDYHAYIFTNLDTERLELGDYIYDNFNVTGFRIVDTSNPDVSEYVKYWTQAFGHGRGRAHPLYSANALMVDAVKLYANAMNDLGNVESIPIEPLNCKGGAVWSGGDTFLRYLKGMEYPGMTGNIYLDENGHRTYFKLDLIERRRDNMVKTGIWLPDTGVNYTTTATERDAIVVEQLQNKTLRVTTAINSPFNIKKALDVPKEALERLSFEEKYEGYVIDFVKALAQEVKFKYKFHLVGDTNYGSKNPDTGEWNGMIGELLQQKADMAVMDLSMTSQRQEAVDFTMPYMNTGVGILFKKKAPPKPNLFSFLSPLSLDVWIYMTTAYLAVSLLMFLLARITPYEWADSNPCPLHGSSGEIETQFTLKNSFWFGIACVLCQGSDILPK